MCGRYACTIQPMGRWADIFKVWIEELADRYNIAPASDIPVFTVSGWQWMRWGLIPSWSREPAGKFSTFNARAESVATKPAFRSAWKQGQRCLVPATGYYEWKKEGGSKIPYFIRSGHGEPLVFAGIWDRWGSGETELLSCSIITTGARRPIKGVHDRMPFPLDPESAFTWLHGSNRDCAVLLQHPPVVEVICYPVDKAVGNVRNQGEGLIKPVTREAGT